MKVDANTVKVIKSYMRYVVENEFAIDNQQEVNRFFRDFKRLTKNMKSKTVGAKTGRFDSSKPNLSNPLSS